MLNKDARNNLEDFLATHILLRIAPGFILFAGINTFIRIHINGELLGLVLFSSISWVIAVLIEQFTFHTYRQKLASDPVPNNARKIPLIFATFGLHILIAIAFIVARHPELAPDDDDVNTWYYLILPLAALLLLLKGISMMRKA